MKNKLIILVAMLFCGFLVAQNDDYSEADGYIATPKTQNDLDNIGSNAKKRGLFIFNDDTSVPQFFDGTTFRNFDGAAADGNDFLVGVTYDDILGRFVFDVPNQTNPTLSLGTVNLSVFTNDAGFVTTSNDADADPNNEIELPVGGSNGQILSTDGAGNYSWVDDQNDDTIADGSETIVNAGANTTVSGTGTSGDPYIINAVDEDDQTAGQVSVFTTNLDNNLSSADDTVQKALETLDELAIGSSGPTYGGTASQGSSLVSLSYDLSTERTITLIHSGPSTAISLNNKNLALQEPVILHLSSSNASGTTFTFDSETFDNTDTSGFSVALAQNEERTLHFVVTAATVVRCTNYPVGSGGSSDGNDYVTGGAVTGENLNLTGTGSAGGTVDLSDFALDLDITALDTDGDGLVNGVEPNAITGTEIANGSIDHLKLFDHNFGLLGWAGNGTPFPYPMADVMEVVFGAMVNDDQTPTLTDEILFRTGTGSANVKTTTFQEIQNLIGGGSLSTDQANRLDNSGLPPKTLLRNDDFTLTANDMRMETSGNADLGRSYKMTVNDGGTTVATLPDVGNVDDVGRIKTETASDIFEVIPDTGVTLDWEGKSGSENAVRVNGKGHLAWFEKTAANEYFFYGDIVGFEYSVGGSLPESDYASANAANTGTNEVDGVEHFSANSPWVGAVSQNTTVYDGTHAIQLTNDGVVAFDRCRLNTPLTDNVTYNISGYLYAPGGLTPVEFTIREYGAGGDGAVTDVTYPGGITAGWVQFTLSKTLPSGQDGFSIRFEIADNETLYFDGFQANQQ